MSWYWTFSSYGKKWIVWKALAKVCRHPTLYWSRFEAEANNQSLSRYFLINVHNFNVKSHRTSKNPLKEIRVTLEINSYLDHNAVLRYSHVPNVLSSLEKWCQSTPLHSNRRPHKLAGTSIESDYGVSNQSSNTLNRCPLLRFSQLVNTHWTIQEGHYQVLKDLSKLKGLQIPEPVSSLETRSINWTASRWNLTWGISQYTNSGQKLLLYNGVLMCSF